MKRHTNKFLLVSLFGIVLIIIIFYFYNHPPFPIDVVYTWAGENISSDQRTAYNNELKYSLRSIMKFAPWVNHIYILVDSPIKVPSWFNGEYKKYITLVSTDTTFPNKSYLPNSNSNAIETTLSEIPGLNEHFIYFNDDFFLAKSCKWTDFFTLTGKPYVCNKLTESGPMETNNKKTNLNIKLPPFPNKHFLKHNWDHHPLPRLKSMSKMFQNEYVDYIDWVRKTMRRKENGCGICYENNLQCPCQQQHALLSQYMYKNNKAALKNLRTPNELTFIESHHIMKNPNLFNNFISRPTKYLCINDTNSNQKIKPIVRQKILKFFQTYYSEKPFFEK